MIGFYRSVALVAVTVSVACLAGRMSAQQPDEATVIRGVDAAVHDRIDRIASYTVTEHYALFRNADPTHPSAEMTVKTTYNKETGKSYAIVSETGSEIIRSMIFGTLLDNEKRINLPANREASWLTSANYEMHLKPGGIQQVDGRSCIGLAINPRQKAPNLVEGTLWVDARDYGVVKVDGKASKNASVFTGTTQMMREYAPIQGFAMATHARAVTESFLFGQAVVTIDYTDYRIQLDHPK